MDKETVDRTKDDEELDAILADMSAPFNDAPDSTKTPFGKELSAVEESPIDAFNRLSGQACLKTTTELAFKPKSMDMDKDIVIAIANMSALFNQVYKNVHKDVAAGEKIVLQGDRPSLVTLSEWFEHDDGYSDFAYLCPDDADQQFGLFVENAIGFLQSEFKAAKEDGNDASMMATNAAIQFAQEMQRTCNLKTDQVASLQAIYRPQLSQRLN